MVEAYSNVFIVMVEGRLKTWKKRKSRLSRKASKNKRAGKEELFTGYAREGKT